MGIRDDIAAIPRKATTFEQWRQQADPEDVEAVMAAVSDPNVPISNLVQVCRANNIPITSETVRSFR